MAKYSNCPMVYEEFQKFKDLCLIEDKSLIWPDKKIWTMENLQQIKVSFIDNPILHGEFWEKVYDQFSGLNDDCWRILADAFLVYSLPSTHMKPDRKYEYIQKICAKRGFTLPDFTDQRWDVLNQGFTKTSLQYHQKYKQLWLIFLLAIRTKQKEDRKSFLTDHKAVREEMYHILDGIEPKLDRAYDMLDAILHLGYPDHYERMISKRDKEKAVKYYYHRINPQVREKGNLDEKLLAIRKSFEENEYRDKTFDFYLPNIKEEWRNDNGTIEVTAGDSPEDVVDEDPFLDELVKTLRSHKQIILYGPPGTGKTYYAQKLARSVIAQDNFEKDYSQLNEEEKQQIQLCPIADQTYLDFPEKLREEGKAYNSLQEIKFLSFCTFHPAYGYEDFIEGYRPEISETGMPTFKLRNGIFKKICNAAKRNPEKTYAIIIDEINRGDIPRIFGELITLIETEKRWRLDEYFPDTSVILPTSGEIFAVPENVIIIGTMNTADQSIALLDIALRRRFGFRELMPIPELLENQEIAGINLGSWLKTLNERILERVGRNRQIGHSYLMKNAQPIKNEEKLIAAVKDEIFPLIQEYCYGDFTALEEILGPRIVSRGKGGFNPEIYSPSGKTLILDFMREMIAGDDLIG